MSTIKQKQVMSKIIENRGNVSKSMRDVGYTENTAKNPKNLTDSKGFQELLSELIDNEELIKEIKKEIKGNDKRVKLQAIDMLLKLKDLYPKLTGKFVGLFERIDEITEEPQEKPQE